MRQNTPEWLQDIQDKSWEPELFISGGAIFFLLQVSDWLHHQSILLLQREGYYEPVVIAALLTAALNALIFGFSVHLILRGFWVAAVTLSYVFPNGIRREKISYEEPYQKHVDQVQDTVDHVIRLETICSLIFSLSFFFFIIIVGAFLTLMIIIPHSQLADQLGMQTFWILRFISCFALFLAFIYLVDFFSLGYFKKHKTWNKIYYPIYRIFSLTTLAPFYRTPYYTLVSNLSSRWLVLGGIAYLLLAFGLTLTRRSSLDVYLDMPSYLNIRPRAHTHDLRYYEAQRPSRELIEHISIQSEIIEDDFLRLFIVHQKIIERLLGKNCEDSRMTPRTYFECCSDIYRVYIDEDYQMGYHWQFHTHPQTGEMGVITFIPIPDLPPGEHMLKIVLNAESAEHLQSLMQLGMNSATYAEIPFWRQ